MNLRYLAQKTKLPDNMQIGDGGPETDSYGINCTSRKIEEVRIVLQSNSQSSEFFKKM